MHDQIEYQMVHVLFYEPLTGQSTDIMGFNRTEAAACNHAFSKLK